MANGSHKLQHWNQWLTHHFLGMNLIESEQQLLSHLLTNHFGKHVLLIGVPHQQPLLRATALPCQTLLGPLIAHPSNTFYIESDFHELPIYTGSIDLVLLPHTMEFLDNPRQLLSEACRIIRPEGLIVIVGFNPFSFWGAKKTLVKGKTAPWTANFIQAGEIVRWLALAAFEMETQKTMLFRPPVAKPVLFQQLKFMESIGSKCFSKLGGIYALVARAKVIPLTPIKMKWKQKLGGIRISTTIPGHVRLRSNHPYPNH